MFAANVICTFAYYGQCGKCFFAIAVSNTAGFLVIAVMF